MYLGEVCYCRLEHGVISAGLAIEQVLTGRQSPARLSNGLSADSSRTPDAGPELVPVLSKNR